MANPQAQFEKFHRTILFGYTENADLVDKKETLLKDLSSKISLGLPSYTHFIQGSYALHTGIVPLGGNPDMDIGIKFDCSAISFPDSLVLKRAVHDALSRSNRTVEIKGPCVTVTYLREGEAEYHVDLAVYANGPEGLMLARGKENQSLLNQRWELSGAEQLIDLVANKYENQYESDQYRRIVRALKRWKDNKLGHKNVPSIAITVAVFDALIPYKNSVSGQYLDLPPLALIIESILHKWDGERVSIRLPVAPFNDLMVKVTDIQMADFKAKLEGLLHALNEAALHPDLVQACEILRAQFGVDFPVPSRPNASKKTKAAVLTSGTSA